MTASEDDPLIPVMLKAITLYQPWATLVALGVKTIETRSWQTKHRGPIAIHAGAKAPRQMARHPSGLMGDWWVVDHEGFPMLLDHQVGRGTHGDLYELSLGAVVATANLVDCVPMVHAGEEGAIRTLDIDGNGDLWLVEPQTDEQAERGDDLDRRDVSAQRPYGDFAPGRWAWLLEDIKPCGPVPAKGKQGLWEWTP